MTGSGNPDLKESLFYSKIRIWAGSATVRLWHNPSNPQLVHPSVLKIKSVKNLGQNSNNLKSHQIKTVNYVHSAFGYSFIKKWPKSIFHITNIKIRCVFFLLTLTYLLFLFSICNKFLVWQKKTSKIPPIKSLRSLSASQKTLVCSLWKIKW